MNAVITTKKNIIYYIDMYDDVQELEVFEESKLTHIQGKDRLLSNNIVYEKILKIERVNYILEIPINDLKSYIKKEK